MKSINQFPDKQMHRCWVLLLGLRVAVSTVVAAETNAPPAAVPAPMTPEQMFAGGTNSYNNWIEFSTGGFLTSGNHASFQQQHQTPGGAFGGLEGFHYGTNLDKTTTLSLDARAIADEHDYKLKLGIERENTGFLRLSYSEFRTWSDGDGGFFPPSDMYYPLSKNAPRAGSRGLLHRGGADTGKGDQRRVQVHAHLPGR